MRSQEQAKSTMDMSEEPFCMEIQRKNAHGHVRRAILCGNFKEKGTGTGHRSHCVPSGDHVLEGSEAHVTRPILYGNLQEKCRTPSPRNTFCVEIYKKNAGPDAGHLDQTPGLLPLP